MDPLDPPDPQAEADAVRSLGERFLRPDRPREAEVRAAVGKTRDRAQVWERLIARGLIPEDWLDTPTRRFVLEPYPKDEYTRYDPKSGRYVLRAPNQSAIPSSVEAIVTVASDPLGVTTAEAYAQELVARYRALADVCPFGGVLWRVLPSTSRFWRGHRDGREAALAWASECDLNASEEGGTQDGVARPLGPRGAELEDRRKRAGSALRLERSEDEWHLDSVAQGVRTCLGHCFALEAAQRWDLRISTQPAALDRVQRGTPYRSIPNPFVAVLGVVKTGYAVDVVRTIERRTWVVLFARSAQNNMPGFTVRRRSSFGRRARR